MSGGVVKEGDVEKLKFQKGREQNREGPWARASPFGQARHSSAAQSAQCRKDGNEGR
jgi:hypothetical protein